MADATSVNCEESLQNDGSVHVSYLWNGLENLTNLSEVLRQLVVQNVITEDQSERIDICDKTTRSKIWELISILSRKWDTVKIQVLQVLNTTGNEHCSRMIEPTFHTTAIASREPNYPQTSTDNESMQTDTTNNDTQSITNILPDSRTIFCRIFYCKQNFCANLTNTNRCIIVVVLLSLLGLGALGILLYFLIFNNSDDNTIKNNLANYLVSISSLKTISGLFVHPGMTNIGEIEDVSRITTRFPGILSSTMPPPDSNEQWKLFISNIKLQWKNGFLVHVGWLGESHPLEKIAADDNEANWEDLITDGGSLNKKWKENLDFVATHLRELQKAGIVVVIDLLPYINDKYHFWRGRPGVNGTSKLFQITHNYMTQTQNLKSLMWSWSLLYNQGEKTYLKEYWPGNEYIDVVTVYLHDPYGDKLPDGKTYSDELRDEDYQHLVNTVEDKPISINRLRRIPCPKLLTRQPHWVWFTIDHEYLNDKGMINTTFHSTCVINKNDIDISHNNIIESPKSSRQC